MIHVSDVSAYRRRSMRWALASIAALGLAGCGGSNYLAQERGGSIDLSGRWELDRQASDDVRATLKRVFDKKDKQWQREAKRIEDRYEEPLPPPDRSGDVSPEERAERRADMSNVQWLRSQNRREVEALIAWLSPALQLDIRQSPNEIEIKSNKAEGTRHLEPGGSSALFLALGGFEINSGWQDRSYIVNSKGTGDNKIRMLETYTLLEDGAVLEERMKVRLPMLGKHEFRFVYRRRR